MLCTLHYVIIFKSFFVYELFIRKTDLAVAFNARNKFVISLNYYIPKVNLESILDVLKSNVVVCCK